MKEYTYILVLFFTIIICFVASFHPKLKFNRQFVNYFKACTVVASFFILWDIWFTKMGVWWFDTSYTLGFTILGLPIEEWLFFWCIPFSCVFTYYCFDKFFNLSWTSGFNNLIAFVTIICGSVVALLHYDKIYTFLTAVVTVITVTFIHFFTKEEWLGKASLVFLVLMLGFFPVNGVLTGTGIESPIVNYNPQDFLGIRMLTIPVEDAVYGYTQFILTLLFFNKLSKAE